MKLSILIWLALSVLSTDVQAKEKKIIMRKTQSVDFDGDTVDGKTRSPDGAYLVQKRSVDFVPLYKVREAFDDSIYSSVDYLK